ncbi:MAG: hypothetical protein CSA62_13325 [Planctomycetota bacterium]|nr:MAG: hypothetical protein CSA62_13325 [Planctomycetota bacterium]
MQQHLREFVIATRGPGAVDISDELCAWVRDCGVEQGLLTLLVRHTSASLVIQENADPQVLVDLQNYLDRLAPHNDPRYLHTAEGPDDMPAHLRSALTSTTLSLPVMGGRPALGTWQAIYLWEHRDQGHRRRIAAQLLG